MTQAGSSPRKCPNCGSRMVNIGAVGFRIGGTSGGWKLLIGEWAELGEDKIPMNIFVCEKCDKIEFYANEKTKEIFRIGPWSRESDDKLIKASKGKK